MAALFFDIDGTVVKFHTNEWLPGVKWRLCELANAGHQINFVTMRGHQDERTEWSLEKTYQLLSELPFNGHLITGVHQPRFLIDDGTPIAIKIDTNNADAWLSRIK